MVASIGNQALELRSKCIVKCLERLGLAYYGVILQRTSKKSAGLKLKRMEVRAYMNDRVERRVFDTTHVT